MAYTALVAGLPAILIGADAGPAGRTWLEALSLALAYEGLAILLLQFALVSRLAPISRAFGSDALTRLHRNMALLAVAFVVAHPLLLSAGRHWSAWMPSVTESGLGTGAIAFWVTAAIVLTSMARRFFRLSYEAWQVVHLGGACVVTAAAVTHIQQLGASWRAGTGRTVVLLYLGLFVALLLRYRVIRPLALARRPWRVVANTDAGGSTRLLRLVPDGHDGLRFVSGQFAWLNTGRHPLTSGQHPLSVASSDRAAPDGAIEFAVKALGDWSGRTVPALEPGRRVYVDGAFGAFTPDLAPGDALVLVAGGIGIAPMRSILLSLRDRGDTRRVILFYAASDLSRMSLRQEIDALRERLNLAVVPVLEKPDASWTGERGHLTAEVLGRHLPADRARAEFFICGPVAMMDAVERSLVTLGVPPNRIHTERFQVV